MSGINCIWQYETVADRRDLHDICLHCLISWNLILVSSSYVDNVNMTSINGKTGNSPIWNTLPTSCRSHGPRICLEGALLGRRVSGSHSLEVIHDSENQQWWLGLTGRGGATNAAAGQLEARWPGWSVAASTCNGPVVLFNPLLKCLSRLSEVDICCLCDLFHVLKLFHCLIHRRLLATVQAEQAVIVSVEADQDQTLNGSFRKNNKKQADNTLWVGLSWEGIFPQCSWGVQRLTVLQQWCDLRGRLRRCFRRVLKPLQEITWRNDQPTCELWSWLKSWGGLASTPSPQISPNQGSCKTTSAARLDLIRSNSYF